jgi:VIT1/CCC1 family predicted Fe2+/Mn2+ transporter
MAEAQSKTAAHLETARKLGRGMLASESEGGQPYEVLHAASAARDGAILVLALWAMLQGIHHPDLGNALLITTAAVVATYTGIANALGVAAQLRHWEHELRREREEIRTLPKQEREELKAIYEAKGFTGEQLDSILDTLCSDDDRLLKVMLEEELGIFFEQWNHPVSIGLITGCGSLVGGLAVAAGAMGTAVWLPPLAAAIIIALAAMVRTGWYRAATVESFTRWSVVAGCVAGAAFFLSQLLFGAAS